MRIIGKETKMRKNKEKGTKNKEMQDLRIKWVSLGSKRDAGLPIFSKRET